MSNAPTPTRKSLSVVSVVIASIGLILFLLFSYFALWVISGVHGSEFSPTHFETQSFEFAEIPLIGVQWQPVVRDSKTDATSAYLVAKKLIQVPSKPPSRWDLVRINRVLFFAAPNKTDAGVLTAYLRGEAGNGVDWEQWSKDHPKAAAVFWPMVQQMAIDRLYLLLPRVFELAENEDDPVLLRKDLDDYLINELPMFAEDLFYGGYQEHAIDALQSAIARYPEESSFGETLQRLNTDADSLQEP